MRRWSIDIGSKLIARPVGQCQQQVDLHALFAFRGIARMRTTARFVSERARTKVSTSYFLNIRHRENWNVHFYQPPSNFSFDWGHVKPRVVRCAKHLYGRLDSTPQDSIKSSRGIRLMNAFVQESEKMEQ